MVRERRLLRAYQANGDERARDELVRDNLPLLRVIARRYAGRRESFEDLLQVASIGLVKAIERFDLDRGVRFRTYAVAVVVGELQRHLRDHSWSVHVPRRRKELAVRLTRLLPSMTTELERSPTIAELARRADADEEDVVDALEALRAYSPASLSDLASGDGSLDHLPALAVADSTPHEVEHRALVEVGLRRLPSLQRRVVELRFFRDWTQEQIAREVGVSQMHVSRLLRSALLQLGAVLEA